MPLWSLNRTRGYNGPLYRARFPDGTEHDVFSPEHHAQLAELHGAESRILGMHNQAPPPRFLELRRWLRRRPFWYVRLRRWLCARGWLHDRIADPDGRRVCVWCDQ